MKIKQRPKGVEELKAMRSVRDGSAFAPKKAAPAKNAEKLMAVAIVRDGETHHGFKSHADLRRSLGDADPYESKRTDYEGFWTDRDRFVSREAAAKVGVESGQLSSGWWPCPRKLLSSDIW